MRAICRSGIAKIQCETGRTPQALNVVHTWSRGIQAAERLREDIVAEAHFTFRLAADNLRKTGWSWGCVSVVGANGRTIWTVHAHGHGKRFIVRADEIQTAFLEAERAIHQFAVSLLS